MICSRESAIELARSIQATGKKVGYTSGVFDLLHVVHVDLLQRARQVCDCLIIGLNTDASVRGNKGPHRPVIDETSRAKMLAALGCVDAIFLFDEANNRVNIDLLRPDLYIKGDENGKFKPLTSAAQVEAYGGKVVMMPMPPEPSTSSIIARIKSLP